VQDTFITDLIIAYLLYCLQKLSQVSEGIEDEELKYLHPLAPIKLDSE
jgi:hypothetical protein